MGTAVLDACREVKSKLRTMAADCYSVAADEVDVHSGVVRFPGREVSFLELMAEAFGPMLGEVIGSGERRGAHIAGHPLGGHAAFYEFSCTVSEVAVDEETGEVQLLRHVTVSDVGKALNPAHLHGQDEGGGDDGPRPDTDGAPDL